MRLAYLAFIFFLGGITFLVSFIADRERQAGVEGISRRNMVLRSALDADPNLKLVSMRSPYMRTER
jgi:hypothetical protein